MSYSLNSLRGFYRGVIIGVTKGDARRLDFCSFGSELFLRGAPKLQTLKNSPNHPTRVLGLSFGISSSSLSLVVPGSLGPSYFEKSLFPDGCL